MRICRFRTKSHRLAECRISPNITIVIATSGLAWRCSAQPQNTIQTDTRTDTRNLPSNGFAPARRRICGYPQDSEHAQEFRFGVGRLDSQRLTRNPNSGRATIASVTGSDSHRERSYIRSSGHLDWCPPEIGADYSVRATISE